MNGHHRREVSGNNSILQKHNSQEEEGDQGAEDAVTDAITKLQENGVNCILFTKNELLNLNNNHLDGQHHHLVKANMRKAKEEQDYNDLLGYEPNLKSINCNSSSLTIQLTNHNNCLVSPGINGRLKRGRRRGRPPKKGSSSSSSKKIQKKPNAVVVKSKRGRKRANQKVVPSPYNLRRQSSSGYQGFLEREGDIISDYLTNGFSTPPPPSPPCLSPECPDVRGQGVQACPFIPGVPDEVKAVGELQDVLSPVPPLSPPVAAPDELEVPKVIGEAMESLLETVVRSVEFNGDGEPTNSNQSVDLFHLEKKLSLVQETGNQRSTENDSEPPEAERTEEESPLTLEHQSHYSDETSLPLVVPDSAMKLRHSTPDGSFYSLVTQNVRYNLENYLDGRIVLPSKKAGGTKRRKRHKNGYLLCHGDNYPHDPELSYKLNLTTQILLKLNRKRQCYKPKPKADKRKSVLAYLNLIPKRPVRNGKSTKVEEAKVVESSEPEEPPSVFSGEWTLENKYVCGICSHEETNFWDMVTHKGEEHSGVLVTHVELPVNQIVPKTLIRDTAEVEVGRGMPETKPIPPCTKCTAKFSSYPDLHRHIFECSGNTDWLNEAQAVKKPTKARRRRRQGFKRRLSNNTPKKNSAAAGSVNSTKVETPTKRKSNADGSTTNLYKCKFCVRHFKTEGWLKNHLATHTLLVSIPFSKLPKRKPSLPQLSLEPRASSWSLRKYRRGVAVVVTAR